MLENQIKKLSWYVFITMILVLLIFVFGYFLKVIEETPPYVGSVQTASEYQSTTTAAAIPKFTYIKTEGGALGSLVITKAGAGTTWNYLYNATTTNNNLRTVSAATSTIIIAAWPGNLAAGTYTFDEIFTTGLILETDGSLGTSTITWR